MRHFLYLASYSSGSASWTRWPTAHVTTCSGSATRGTPSCFCERPRAGRARGPPDGRLLGDDERLAHERAQGSDARERQLSAQGPVDDRRRARPRATVAHDRVRARRSRRAAPRRASRRRPSSRRARAPSTSGPPELPGRTRAAQRRDRAAHRAAAVGVLGERPSRVAPSARRRARRTGPLRGKPRIAAGVPGRGVGGERQRRRAEPGDAQHRDVVRGSNAIAVRVERRPVAAAAARACRPGPRRRARW